MIKIEYQGNVLNLKRLKLNKRICDKVESSRLTL